MSLTLSVSDDERMAPWNIGTFRLSVNPAGVPTCEKTSEGVEVDVAVGISGLTSLWSGAASARDLAAWGLLDATRCDFNKRILIFY